MSHPPSHSSSFSGLTNGNVRNGSHAQQANASHGDGAPEVYRSADRIADPAISLVVPALNEEKLIGGMLRCFPVEDLKRLNVEIIVSDGGSTDSTVAIARDHADIVVRHTQKRRQTIAEGRNLGAKYASGELLVFINADTVPQEPRQFLQALGEFVGERRSGVVALACPVSILPDEHKWSDAIFHTFFNNYVRMLNYIGLGMGRGECQVVWRKDFEEVGGYQDHMAAGEDFDLFRRLASRGRIRERKGLRVYESPRRFRRFGYARILLEWTLNALAVMVIGRSISKEWEEIR